MDTATVPTSYGPIDPFGVTTDDAAIGIAQRANACHRAVAHRGLSQTAGLPFADFDDKTGNR